MQIKNTSYRAITTHLSEWLIQKIVTTPNTEKWDHSSVAVGKCKMAQSIWENDLAVSYKTKNTITIWPSNWTLRHLSKRNMDLSSHKNLYSNVHSKTKKKTKKEKKNVQSSFICNIPKLKTAQMSFNQWMVNIYIHIKEYYSVIKRN